MDSLCFSHGLIDVGGRIVLRPMQGTYAEGLWISYWRNRERSRYFCKNVVTPTSHMRWFAGRSPLDEVWTVHAKADSQRPVGLTSITVDSGLPTGEYGRTLVDEYWQGRNIGREIEYTAMMIGFEFLRLEKLWGELYVDNAAIAHVHDAIGWTRIGVNVPGHVYPDGDVIYIECTREQWTAMRQEFADWMREQFESEIRLGEWSR